MNWYEDGIKKHRQYQLAGLTSDIDILHPQFAFNILKLFINAHKEGLRVCIFETYRSQERQLDLFNKGKTKLSKNGMHHFGIATDVVFRTEKNQPIWQGDWAALGKIGKELGLHWGGDWESFRDYPHFQLIPATVSDQAKIINGAYPPCDDKVRDYVQQLIPHYAAVIENNYADDKFDALIRCYENLFTTPGAEAIKEPEPEKIEVAVNTSDEKPKTETTAKLQETKIEGLIYLIINFLNKWLKRKQ